MPVGRLHKRKADAPTPPDAPSPSASPPPPDAVRVDRSGADTTRREARILVVDADSDALARTAYLLTADGYRITTARSGAEAWQLLTAESLSLLVTRSVLRDGSGLELVRRLTTSASPFHVPTMVLLMPGESDAQRMQALASGADECLAAAAEDAEMILRVRALLRRSKLVTHSDYDLPLDEVLEVGVVRANLTRRELTVGEHQAMLSPSECEVIRLLLGRPNRVVRSEEIRQVLSGDGPPLQAVTVRMHIHRLRGKFGEYARILATVPNVGFVLRAPKTL